jgi:hypothetical protein
LTLARASRDLTVEEIETLSALVGDYDFEASLKCLVDIAERLDLRLSLARLEYERNSTNLGIGLAGTFSHQTALCQSESRTVARQRLAAGVH